MDTIEYKNHLIVIGQDSDYESPREWDNLGTMYCSHRRYNLGDVQVSGGMGGFLWKVLCDENTLISSDEKIDFLYYNKEYLTQEESEKYINILCDNFIVLPLFLYDHSGISMSTSNNGYPFNDYFDSGQVGYIIVSKDKIRQEFKWKNLTKKRISKILEYLRNEVQIYDDYLTGNVYYYQIMDTPEDYEEGDDIDFETNLDFISSCNGFYGDIKTSGLLEQAKSEIDYHIEHEESKENGN